MSVVRTCRTCGCTEHDCRKCIQKIGHPCHWVEADLCSACSTEPIPAKVKCHFVPVEDPERKFTLEFHTDLSPIATKEDIKAICLQALESMSFKNMIVTKVSHTFIPLWPLI